MTQLPTPKAILFDWDNTLADSWPLIHQALHDTMVEMDQEPWDLEYTRNNVHRSMRDYFPTLFGDAWEDAAHFYHGRYRHHRPTKLQPLPDAKPLLDLLKKQDDIYVALVSNKMGKTLREEVTNFTWDNYFSSVIGAQDAEADKPAAAPVTLALSGSNIAPSQEVWFVGDSVTDMECAHNTGCTPILYGPESLLEGGRFNHCPPKKHVKHFNELMVLLEEG